MFKGQTGKGAPPLNGRTLYGLPETGLLDFQTTWNSFMIHGWSLVTNVINKGIDKKSAVIDKKLYMANFDIMLKISSMFPEETFKHLREAMENYVNEKVAVKLQDFVGKRLLRNFVSSWHNHLFMSIWMQRFFRNLDSVRVDSAHTVSAMLLRTFLTAGYEKHKKNIVQASLEEITKYRDKVECDMDLVSDVSKILVHLGCLDDGSALPAIQTIDGSGELRKGTWKTAPQLHQFTSMKIYEKDLEEKLLLHTKNYYKKMGAKWIRNNSVSDYLGKAVEYLDMEEALVRDRLDIVSRDKLIREYQQMILVGPNRSYLEFILKADTGVGFMLVNNNFDDLKNMHRVLSGINEQQPMADAVRDHISSIGCGYILDRSEEIKKAFRDNKEDGFGISKEFINHLLSLYRLYDQLIEEAFKKDPLFEKSLVQAFQKILKVEPGDYLNAEEKIDSNQVERHICSNSVMLAHCIDYIYKHERDFDTIEEFETRLTECASLFEYLTDKDTGIAFHKMKLSERLLSKKYCHPDKEKFFISIIKINQGTHFTNQCETMIADLERFLSGKTKDKDGKKLINYFPTLFEKKYLKGETGNSEDLKHSKRWADNNGGLNVKLLTKHQW